MSAPDRPTKKPEPSDDGWSRGGVGLSEEPETPEQEAARLAWKKKQREEWDRMMSRRGQ